MQRCRKTTLHENEVLVATYPPGECFERLIFASQDVCRFNAELNFMPKDRDNQIGPCRESPIESADANTSSHCDLLHRGIYSLRRKDPCCCVQQRVIVALRIRP